ncbi:hypothetical protein DL240_04680 [Lujinxingia litoralis]|uniref:Peptidase C-terminal archaeal/bacterial domain-containing protein n=1 Tax=Lujinxingia litoralis TaxID=2211119 RepID=A0A328CED0_9DELT|nr:hypothetical protein [Lujinxingia litoralis]RAL25509.1 hypothetical protein DL240_04680 [Lujinxingia litoralis]
MSKKLLSLLLVGMLAGPVVACGGGDEPADTPDVGADVDETDGGDETDSGDVDSGPHAFEAEVDTWFGNLDNDPETPESIEPGETIGGQLVGGEDDSEAHFFALTLEAGTALKVTVEGTDGDLAVAGNFNVRVLSAIDGSGRFLVPNETTQSREFFIYEEGAHEVAAVTGAGLSGAYKISTEVVELAPQAPTLPGVTDGDMSDGSIQVFEVVADVDGTLAAETLALREPLLSGVDTSLHVWDVAAATRVAFNDDIDLQGGVYDSRVYAEVTNGNTYYVVVDSYANDASGEFQLTMETYEGGAGAPVELTDGAEITDTVDARLIGVDVHAYTLTVQPGENFRVVVEGADELAPAIVAVSGPAGEEQQAGSSLPVEGRSAMYVGVGADEEEAQVFTLYVSDERNLTEGAEPVGGETFGYTLTVDAAARNAVSLEASTSSTQVLADVGNVTWFDVVVPAKTIVSLAVETEVAEDDFIPLVVSAAYWTFSPAFGSEAVLYNDADEAVTMPVLVRDFGFRGSATTTYALNASFVNAALPDSPNTLSFTEYMATAAEAKVLHLPAQVSGLLDTEVAQEVNPEALPSQFFSMTLTAGDVLVARTSRGAEAPADPEADDPSTTDTILTLYNAADDSVELLQADYYIGQADAGTFFSAFAYTIEEDGDYVLKVAPYCQSVFGMSFCSDGEYKLDVFTN